MGTEKRKGKQNNMDSVGRTKMTLNEGGGNQRARSGGSEEQKTRVSGMKEKCVLRLEGDEEEGRDEGEKKTRKTWRCWHGASM
ncbi:hypothetical protein JOQ06_020169 [Pogonophryne albipinna]|uniref:Uncharacterized protein n=1 Tax=Pogonophryne albipinna TaxID=1090488 RepID=A0AAD6BQJ2_9TELE|nr:hypothetical protein JOQ06_020169 [Pogonophryne albipinna]